MLQLAAREDDLMAGKKLKPSEYGGSDTRDTLGIQPTPHALTAAEKLRVMYHEDPMDEESKPIPGLATEE